MEKKNISLMTACSKIGMGGADALAPAGTRASETTMLNTAGVRHRKFFFLFKKKKNTIIEEGLHYIISLECTFFINIKNKPCI